MLTAVLQSLVNSSFNKYVRTGSYNDWKSYLKVIDDYWSQRFLGIDETQVKREFQLCNTDPIRFTDYMLKLPFVLSPIQQHILGTYYGHLSNPAAHYFSELQLVCGRKGGKTTLVGDVASFKVYRLLQMEDIHKFFGILPDETIDIVVVATGEKQALGVTMRKIRAVLYSSWYLPDYIVKDNLSNIIFEENIVVNCITASPKAGRGFNSVMNIYDEQAHFDKRAGEELWEALQPNLTPFGIYGETATISTPMGKDGIFWENFQTGEPCHVLQPQPEHGKEDWRATFQYPTWKMNPHPKFAYDSPKLTRERNKNPAVFEREYGAMFAEVKSAAISAHNIMACAIGRMMDIRKRKPFWKKLEFKITLDPATTGREYALAMGHLRKKKNEVVIDYLKTWKATWKAGQKIPINILEVEDLVKYLCDNFNVIDIGIDQFQSAETVIRLKEEELPIRLTRFTTKYNFQIYDALIGRINLARIIYPKYAPLINQLMFLQEKKVGRTWKYEAAKGHLDDLADVVANLTYMLTHDIPRGMWGSGT